jgi:hypothetical protein
MAGYTVEDCECCIPPCCNVSPAEMVVNLGAGGWNNVSCDDCDGISGEYTLDVIDDTGPTRTWKFSDYAVCTLVDPGGAPAGWIANCEDGTPNLFIWFYVLQISNGNCRLRVEVRVEHNVAVDDDDPDEFCCQHKASYELENVTDEECDGPYTLTKFSEVHHDGDWNVDCCDGTMPATITVEIP